MRSRATGWLVFGVIVAAALLLYKLDSLTHGLSASEVAASSGISLSAIWHDPLFLPIKLIRLALFSLASEPSVFLVRLPSVIFGAVALAAFAYILRQWYGWRAMLYGTALFGLSSWFLHAARLANFENQYLVAFPVIIALMLALQRNSKNIWLFFGAPVILAFLAYIPGLIWLVLLTAVLHWRKFNDGWIRYNRWWQRGIWLILAPAALALLVIALVRSPSLIKTWLGAPAHPDSIVTLGRNFIEVFEHIFVSGAHQPELWLAGLPALGIFTTAMFLVGAYFYILHYRAPRSQLLLTFIILSAVLIALGGEVGLSLILPLIYLVAIAGIGYLLRDWFKVFPKNPLARKMGMAIVILAIGMACFYNLRQYFIAWPLNRQTRIEFRHQLTHNQAPKPNNNLLQY